MTLARDSSSWKYNFDCRWAHRVSPIERKTNHLWQWCATNHARGSPLDRCENRHDDFGLCTSFGQLTLCHSLNAVRRCESEVGFRCNWNHLGILA